MPLAHHHRHSSRVRPASHYAEKDSTIARMVGAAKPALKKDMLAALTHLGTLVNLKKAKQYASAADWHGLKNNAIDWGHFKEVLKGVFARAAQLRHDGGNLGAKKINGRFAQAGRKVRFRKLVASKVGEKIDKAIGDRFDFDLFDGNTLDRIRADQDAFIKDLTTSSRDAVDEIVRTAGRYGLGPDEIAEDVRDLIGLTDRQAAAVMNYRSMLEDLDPDALRRQLRNEAYDAEIQDAIDSGEFLDADIIDAMASDYYENYLDFRSDAISETETSRAIHAGLNDAYSQAIERGALPDEAVRRFWRLGDSPCPICESIADNSEEGVGVDEPFDSDDGPIDDPPVHTHCQCEVEYVTDLDMVEASDEEQSAEEE